MGNAPLVPIQSNEPSQPPPGPQRWLATTCHFCAECDEIVGYSNCTVAARNWKYAMDAAAVKLGADPAWIVATRLPSESEGP